MTGGEPPVRGDPLPRGDPSALGDRVGGVSTPESSSEVSNLWGVSTSHKKSVVCYESLKAAGCLFGLQQ